MLSSNLLLVRADEDEVEGENGEEWEDNSIYKCVIESCSGWRLNKVLLNFLQMKTDYEDDFVAPRGP